MVLSSSEEGAWGFLWLGVCTSSHLPQAREFWAWVCHHYPYPIPTPYLANGSSKYQGPVWQPGAAREGEGICSQAVER